MSKDLFSGHSNIYARFRPGYPPELFDYLMQFVQASDRAWDCATGNGQAARMLADHFQQVEATDISAAQIRHAIPKQNIRYQVCPAEHTPFADNSFDLITVATAYHWLDPKEFSREATRVGKPGAVVAVWAYNMVQVNEPQTDALIRYFYDDIIHDYWDPERKFVDESYRTIEFPFQPLPSRDFELHLAWSREQLTGYLQSWSAVQKYMQHHHSDPVELIREELNAVWKGDELKKIMFPLFLKLGRIEK